MNLVKKLKEIRHKAVLKFDRYYQKFGRMFRPIQYSTGKAPFWYHCDSCWVTGQKLWRQYMCFNPWMFCVDCALERMEKPQKVLPNGKSKSFDDEYTDQLDGLVPAVPDQEGFGYWGYSTVPSEGYVWWVNLLLRNK